MTTKKCKAYMHCETKNCTNKITCDKRADKSGYCKYHREMQESGFGTAPSISTHYFQNDDWFVPKVGPKNGEFRTDWLGMRIGSGSN